MITATKSSQVSSTHFGNDWSFLPTAISALIGVGIGMGIGYYLGWL